jgi:hypothetical protein
MSAITWESLPDGESEAATVKAYGVTLSLFVEKHPGFIAHGTAAFDLTHGPLAVSAIVVETYRDDFEAAKKALVVETIALLKCFLVGLGGMP